MRVFASTGSSKNYNNVKKIKGTVNGITFTSPEFSGTMDSQYFWDALVALAKKENKFIELIY